MYNLIESLDSIKLFNLLFVMFFLEYESQALYCESSSALLFEPEKQMFFDVLNKF